jgi:transcriptional regulator with XRE-family HTH domain
MPAHYDRSLLRKIAITKGHYRPADVARELGIGRMTAWRLWEGVGKPGPETMAAVQAEYGMPAAALLIPVLEESAS